MNESKQIYATLSLDRAGNVIEVKDRHNKLVPAKSFEPPPKNGGQCPEGQAEIRAVKNIQVEYVTCADNNDPCWVYDPVTKRWYKIC